MKILFFLAIIISFSGCGGGGGNGNIVTTPVNNVADVVSTPEDNVADVVSTPEDNVADVVTTPEDNVADVVTTPENAVSNAPNFNIVTHSDINFTATNRKVMVFGIPIYAFAEVEDGKLLHAANIMAQYIDNDEDGNVDNQTLLDALITNNASLFMWKTEDQSNLRATPNAQDLGADETIPDWHSNGHTGEFDAALEEVWHVITNSGYKNAYPSIFGLDTNTSLTNAMDVARGGQFTTIPTTYPNDAWYTYDDTTCFYSCMATEYIYWAMTSILGAQENRLEDEWDLNTSTLVQATDATIYNLLTDTQYKFPTVLPDGTYNQ